MALQHITIKDGCGAAASIKRVKMGRLPPKKGKPVLKFGNYLTGAALAVPPSKVDYGSKASAALKRMYLNDTYGDCVIAGKYHATGIWTGNESGTPVQGTDQEVLTMYHTICGPGDNGCNITDVLDYFQKTGLPFNGVTHTIDGYVSVDWTNKLQVQTALFLFGALSLGINLPDDWTCTNCIWDTTTSKIVGGHDVTAMGYDATGVQISTWAGIVTITWPALLSRKWLEECYAPLASDWYANANLAPCGVDVTTLRNDLQIIKGGGTPPIPDPTPPGPTPPPVPPPVPPTPPVPPPSPTPGLQEVLACVDRAFANLIRMYPPRYRSMLQGTNKYIDSAIKTLFAGEPSHTWKKLGEWSVVIQSLTPTKIQTASVKAIPWATILAAIQGIIAKYGPAAVPIIEGYINSLPLSDWQKQLIKSVVEALLLPQTSRFTTLKGATMVTIPQQLADLKGLCLKIASQVGVESETPMGFRNKIGDAGPGMVTVTFNWDPPPASDNGVTASYLLQITAPDGTPQPPVPLGLVTTDAQVLTDDTGTWAASLTPLDVNGVAGPAATTTFVPHIAPPPPPPQLPSQPTGFTAVVGP